MKTTNETTTDKTSWGEGPWRHEPDKAQWLDKETGLPCLLVRNRNFGHYCGYVGVSRDHPDYGKDYDDVPACVHGGLTYASKCADDICHAVEPGEDDDVWWLGFDCLHAGDLAPVQGAQPFNGYGQYRTEAYVRQECAALALQLAQRVEAV